MMAFLRNPLAWYKQYVEGVFDQPSSPSSLVGKAAHKALEHFYSGIAKEGAIELGLEYLRSFSDFEVNFGRAKTKADRRKRREGMERDFRQAVSFYLEKPPRYEVLGVEVKAIAAVPGLPLPVKAVSDLVVRSRGGKGAVDIVDHKFVDSWSALGAGKSLFVIQALFNYYTVRETFGADVRRFIVHECKKTRNVDGRPQLRRYVLDFQKLEEEFDLFHRLLGDASTEIARERIYLPNPSDMFEGENSFAIYRLGLTEK